MFGTEERLTYPPTLPEKHLSFGEDLFRNSGKGREVIRMMRGEGRIGLFIRRGVHEWRDCFKARVTLIHLKSWMDGLF